MRDWITVGKESKDVKAQIADVLRRLDQQKHAYEAMGALKENMRIMALLAHELDEQETETAEAKALIVFRLMQTLRLPG